MLISFLMSLPPALPEECTGSWWMAAAEVSCGFVHEGGCGACHLTMLPPWSHGPLASTPSLLTSLVPSALLVRPRAQGGVGASPSAVLEPYLTGPH